MDLGLQGKAALVMAASQGLGKAVAEALAREGAKVMIASRNEEALRKAREEIEHRTGAEVFHMACDVTKKDDIVRTVRAVGERWGTVDVLVTNAGGPPAGRFADFTDEDWHAAFQLNLLSVVRTIREVLPYMKKQMSGRIVNIASAAFKQPIDGLILSNVFRTGIAGLSKSLSQELAEYKILINTVGPGRIATKRVEELDKKVAEQKGISFLEARKSAEAAIPLGRYGTPEEFARFVAFLASEANSYVTGQALLVDGGMVKAL